jgi:hypothetical protein
MSDAAQILNGGASEGGIGAGLGHLEAGFVGLTGPAKAGVLLVLVVQVLLVAAGADWGGVEVQGLAHGVTRLGGAVCGG